MRPGVPPVRAVPFLDVRAAYDELRDELDAAYRRVMESGAYVLGREVEAFEHEFAAYCGAEHCVAVASGLDALTLSLRALDVGAGDEVIVPGHTYIATWLAVSALGARPVPVDVEEATGNLDPAALASGIGSGARAVIPVHLYGQPAALEAITATADRHGIPVVEDAAQAHGATLGGARVGSLGRAAAFSFYPSKNLGAFGDGGAIVTDDAELAACVRLHRNYGSSHKYRHEVKGLNSRLDPLQAAFLRVKLARLDSWNDRRRAIARRYLEAIEERAGELELPRTLPGAEPVWHTFVVRSRSRDELAKHLSSRGIATLIHYPIPPHASGAYGDAGPWRPLPVSERLAATVLSLPIGPHLSDDDVSRVVDAVNTFDALPACDIREAA
jgi:dTDP-3-amino-3,4,6-trideoxy-alpha-D-glucose transaminase